YNAALSKEYRKKAMEKFKEGTVRILVCTDAAGMGCNIPDIDVVVQWKLPSSVSVFVQRAGRAARAYGRTSIAILLVEPSAYAIDLFAELAKEQPAKEKESEAEKRKKAQERKAYAKSRGINRGAAGGKHNVIPVADTPPLDPEAANEGLYVLVQSGTCRRAILTTIYRNKPA
ncbi:P-loop containing nucleoside triphosphate hydrolase protein, partial [Mycena albidolilacea]